MNDLNEKDVNPENENPAPQKPAYTGKAYAFIGVGLLGAGALAIGLTFTVLGIYSLISSILLCLASLAFINVQKKKNDFKNLLIIRICAYAVLSIAVILFVGGLIWSTL